MERLTLHEIAPYLPYGLYYQLKGNFPLKEGIDNFIEEIFKLNPFGCEVKKLVEWDTCKPILRPMNLTTPIKIDGVEVVPIVELAKIAFPDDEFHIVQERCYSKDGLYRFDFIKSWFICGVYDEEWWRNENVINQLALFQYLYKNKFDIHGLIPAGLAIDVNTLETNPYEL